ncbi:stage II sporulation protein P [Bacillus sp. BGMRC 2118]|nr:stage II sporulation protein P [Bacillus sp. BGMRC 2118]
MQTDKELFEFIKENYPLNPGTKFVIETENKLRNAARKVDRNIRIKQLSFAFIGVMLFGIASSWVYSESQKDVMPQIVTTINEDKANAGNGEEPLVYLYQTHNKESFNPEIGSTRIEDAMHHSNNITLIGERLTNELKERNISTIHDKTDISKILKERNLSYEKSYAISRETLKASLEKNKGLKMIFDIHRDTLDRKVTTINLNDKDYARLSFVISKSNPHYEENYNFALLLHDKIEEKYPGLSRGVVVNSGPPYNTYNQELFANSVILDVGGVENSLEEGYRTMDAFSEILKDVLNVLE